MRPDMAAVTPIDQPNQRRQLKLSILPRKKGKNAKFDFTRKYQFVLDAHSVYMCKGSLDRAVLQKKLVENKGTEGAPWGDGPSLKNIFLYNL